MSRKRKSQNCQLWPMITTVDGSEPSETYQELSKKVNNRHLTNLIYAYSLQPEIRKDMEQKGYKRNKQGEFFAKDIYDFLKVDKLKNDSALTNSAEMKFIGAMDVEGNLIDFTDAEQAMNIADDYNQKHEGKVASVRQVGNVYNIVIENRDSLTLDRLLQLQKTKAKWESLKQKFADKNVDLAKLVALNPEFVNPFNADFVLNYMKAMPQMPHKSLSPDNVKFLLTVSETNPIIQNAISRYGDIDAAVDRIVSAMNDTSSVPQGELSFLQNVLNKAKELNGLDIGDIVRTIGFEQDIVNASLEDEVNRTIKKLNQEYGLDRIVIKRTTAEVNKLSEAAADALMTLKRQLDNLSKRTYNEENADMLAQQRSSILSMANQLSDAIEQGNYYKGLIDVLSQAELYINTMDKVLRTPTQSNDVMESSLEKAHAVARAQLLYQGYYNIVSALSNIDMIITDEAINQQQKQSLRDTARKVQSLLDRQKRITDGITEDIVKKIAIMTLGNTTQDGQDVASLVEMHSADSSLTDFLYSMGRVSNPMIGTVLGIIRNEQRERDKRMVAIGQEIDRLNHKLFQSGSDSSFMYEDLTDKDGNVIGQRIISDIDWQAYNKERSKYFWSLTEMGIKGYELMDEMDKWEYENTIKDDRWGTNERIPNQNFRKENPVDLLTDAQRDYYVSMMQLKAELQRMLPQFAQNLYLPPQVRKNEIQILDEVTRKQMSASDAYDIFRDRTKNWLKVREDDERFQKNGYYKGEYIEIDGKQYNVIDSNFDNTPLRQIPLFYVNSLHDFRELTHDFSQAMRKFASTAINYDSMNKIKDLVETMADYIQNEDIAETNQDGDEKVDATSEGKSVVIARVLKRFASNTNTQAILEGHISRQIYGRNYINENDKVNILINKLLDYTRIKALAVNVKGFIANTLVGEVQNLIEAIGSEQFTLADYSKAAVQLFTNGNIMDHITNNVNSKGHLLTMRFNPSQEVFRDQSGKRYYRNGFSKLFGEIDTLAGYSVGEYIIHTKIMYSILNNRKVFLQQADGSRKRVSLFDVIKKSDKIDGNSELYILDGVTTLDGRKLESLDDEYFDAIQRQIEYTTQNCHGAMNAEDKGVIGQRMIGRLTMTFRQWMVEHYSRRYRTMHWDNSSQDVIMENFYYDNKVYIDGEKHSLYDAFEQQDNGDGSFTLKLRNDVEIKDANGVTVDEDYVEALFNTYKKGAGYREGFYTTIFGKRGLFAQTLREAKRLGLVNAYKEAKGELSPNQRYNLKRMNAAIMMMSLLLLQDFFAEAPDDDNEEFWYRMWLYQVKRLKMEEEASSPMGLITESGKIINQLIPSQSVLYGLMYPVLGLAQGDFLEEGKYRKYGHAYKENKYWHNVKKYSIPFYSQIDQLVNMAYDDDVYKVFERNFKAY